MSFRPGDGGKGSVRRPGNGFEEGHARIFGAKPVKARWVPPPLPGAVVLNKRHDLDPDLVRQQIDAKVASYERTDQRMKAAANKTVETVSWYAGQIEYEKTHYSSVRVIELPKSGKRFILVYGDVDDATVTCGTGPFETLQEAEAWFLNGGR